MKPMLAAHVDLASLRYPVLASPKLDGVRCLVVNGVALSRSMKPIPNKYVQSLFGHRSLNNLDGELVVGPPAGHDVFQRTSSGVMSVDGFPDVSFHVFDDFSLGTGFRYRHLIAKERVFKFEDCTIVKHVNLMNEEALLEYEAMKLSEGYEGIMLRDPNGLYKHGRSTVKEGGLLKLKRFVDSEAEVIGFTQLMHNDNPAVRNELGHLERSSAKDGKVALEALGSLLVVDLKTKVAFEIGTGFDANQRRELWLNRKKLKGKLVKYKSQPVGVKDKPRFPVFLGFRSPEDL